MLYFLCALVPLWLFLLLMVHPEAKKAVPLPGKYEFKVIGDSSPEFLSRLTKLVENTLGSERLLLISQRESEKGKYIAYSITTHIEVFEEIEKVYLSLKQLQGVKFYI